LQLGLKFPLVQLLLAKNKTAQSEINNSCEKASETYDVRTLPNTQPADRNANNKILCNAVPGGRVVTAGGGAVAGAVVAAGGTPVLTTPGGNVVPGTGGTGGPVVTPGGTIGGPVVTPGGTIDGAVGLTPAKCTRSSGIAEGLRDVSCQLKSCQLPCNSEKLLIRQVLTKSMV